MNFRIVLLVILILFCAFVNQSELSSLSLELQNNLTKVLFILPEINSDKTKLEVTSNGFIRFTQTYKNGKQHYASLNLNRFSGMYYFGTTRSGFLVLYSIKKNVIVQTFHDPSGEVDSMSNRLNIPITMIDPEQLDLIQNQLQRFKNILKKQ